MAVIGPGAEVERATDIEPLLNGITDFEYVTVLNPMTDDFAVKVAMDVPVNVPYTARNKDGAILNETEINQIYGVPMRGPDFKGRQHLSTSMVIRAGETYNFKGPEALVAVRQLVNEIMQRDGNQRLQSDPHLRNEVEQKIVISRGSVQDIMDRNLQSPRSQIDDAINRSNEVPHGNEQPFPGLRGQVTEKDKGTTVPNPNPGSGVTYSPKKLGRPKKTDR